MAVPDAQESDAPSQSTLPAFDKLVTTDQSIVLNTIDKLRSHGVSKYIKLPQIIVCGDQSAGKSSVLEAISHLSFPRSDKVCTTFPTELALRRGPKGTVKVQLKPAPSRPESERILLTSYQSPNDRLEEFSPLIEHAKNHLKENGAKDRKADSFFEDTLHVEVTDPTWPPLSLVDLPGLISSPNPQQTSEDVTIVNEMVSKYMANDRSIILAVISAKYPFQVQMVWKLIEKYDPLGKRTICVITKPDEDSSGSDDMPIFVDYAQNKQEGYHFELDWHVVMNRAHNGGTQTWEERDKAEKAFFNEAPWRGRLRPSQLGINKLRDRLSTLLERHTHAEIPGVLAQIRISLRESREELFKLGPARYTSEDQRIHLTSLSQRFENLVRQGTNGHYDDSSFFLPQLPETDPRKLRAALQNLNENFAKRMHEKGHSKQIFNGIGVDPWPSSAPQVFSYSNQTSVSPEIIARSEYIKYVKSLFRKNRGTELIGSPNFRLVRDLFIDLSSPWRTVATEHLDQVLGVVTAHLSAVSDNVASPEIASALRREVVFDAMNSRHKRVLEKLEELLKPYEKGHPITYDVSYIQNSRKVAKAGVEDIEDAECIDVLNSTHAYYEGAIRTFIDNVAVLAVEGCLIDELENVFSATEVVRMDEQKLRALGGESEQAQADRLELEQKVAALDDAQREFLRAGAILDPATGYQAKKPSTTITPPSSRGKTPATSRSQSPTPSASKNIFGYPNTAKDTAVGSISAFSKADTQTPDVFGKPIPSATPAPSTGLFGSSPPYPGSSIATAARISPVSAASPASKFVKDSSFWGSVGNNNSSGSPGIYEGLHILRGITPIGTKHCKPTGTNFLVAE